jgi:pilus assembly protein CpaB
LLLALTAGVVAFVTMQRVATVPAQAPEVPKVPVVVASHDIAVHTVITEADLEVRQMEPDLIPAGALSDTTEAVGKLTTADLAMGEIVLSRRLIAPDYVGPNAAFVMDPKKVLIAFGASDLLSNVGILRPGDHVDLMLTFDFSRGVTHTETSELGVNTLTVLQDLEVASLIYTEETRETANGNEPQQATGAAPRAILFAVDPQDALLIKYFRDMGGVADFALRSPVAEGTFDVVPVDGYYLLQRFRVRGSGR